MPAPVAAGVHADHPVVRGAIAAPAGRPRSEQVADKHADEKMVATKLMRWSWELTDAQHGGLSTRQFVRLQLMRLQLGEHLTHFTYGGMPRRIASIEEVLALKPEQCAHD